MMHYLDIMSNFFSQYEIHANIFGGKPSSFPGQVDNNRGVLAVSNDDGWDPSPWADFPLFFVQKKHWVHLEADTCRGDWANSNIRTCTYELFTNNQAIYAGQSWTRWWPCRSWCLADNSEELSLHAVDIFPWVTSSRMFLCLFFRYMAKPRLFSQHLAAVLLTTIFYFFFAVRSTALVEEIFCDFWNLLNISMNGAVRYGILCSGHCGGLSCCGNCPDTRNIGTY